MQEASVNFTRAVTGAARVRTDQLLIDWSGDGTDLHHVLDTFNRTAVASWSAADTGQTWLLTGAGGTVQNSDFDVTPGAGTMEIPTDGAHRMVYLADFDGDTGADFDMLVNFSSPAPSGAALEPANLLLRLEDASTYLMMRVTVAVGGAITLQAIEVDGGETTLATATVTRTTQSAGVSLSARAQIYGPQLRMRCWATADPEPLDQWDIAVDYDSGLTVGGAGLRAGVASGNLNAKPVVVTFTRIEITNNGLDDMSRRLGDWSVDHHLDDGLPDEVSFVAGTAVPTLRAGIIRPGWLPGRGRMTNRSFFSPYNEDSPIHGIERDVPPVVLSAGVVTDDGRERLPVFTGQAQDFGLRGNQAALLAISAARLALAKLVQPPAVYGFYEGANATWLISYALAACGVYPSPPPQEGCRLWLPLHGSVHQFIPATNQPQVNTALVLVEDGTTYAGNQKIIDAPWIDGPFVAAPDLGEDADAEVRARIDNLATGDGLPLADGDDLVSQAGNLGKVEFWVKCDPNANTSTTLSRFFLTNTNGTLVDCGISAANRRPFITINVGTGNDTFFHSTALPTDGEWRFVGYAWKIDSPSKRWINLDGAEETDNTSFAASGLPTVDTFTDIDPRLFVRIPVAEVQLTAGPTANPDNFPWLMDIPFTAGAQVVRSSVNLVSIAERAPREAWDIVSSMGLAELAMLRIDESDVVRYLGWRHWGQAAQQSIVDVLSTGTNMGTPDLNIDATKIRNAVSATFSEGFNIDKFSSGGSLFDVITLPPGVTILVLPTDRDIVELRGFSFDYIEAADTVEPSTANFVSINLSSDGTGAYATSAEVAVSVLDWNPGEVTIQFDNTSGTTWYTANDLSFATVNIAGKILDLKSRTITESDDVSIAVRGERGLGPLPLSSLQRAVDARRTAQRIVNDLSEGVPTIAMVEVRGNPARQPGDLVTVVDTEAGVNNRFRIQSVYHEDDGELYTQRVTLRRARQGGYWGIDAYWGETIWTTD